MNGAADTNMIRTGARYHAMDAAALEFWRAGAAVGRRRHAVSLAVKRHRRHGDRRQLREPPLDVGISRIAVRKTVAMAIAVDHDVDLVGIVVRDRGPLEARIVEMPVRR